MEVEDLYSEITPILRREIKQRHKRRGSWIFSCFPRISINKWAHYPKFPWILCDPI